MEEFDVARPGTIYFDKVLDDMFAQYVDTYINLLAASGQGLRQAGRPVGSTRSLR